MSASDDIRRAPWDAAELPVPLIPVEQTFEGWLGLEWLSLTRESAHVRFEVREDLKQPLGLMHGGIYCSVAESIASVATVRAVFAEGQDRVRAEQLGELPAAGYFGGGGRASSVPRP